MSVLLPFLGLPARLLGPVGVGGKDLRGHRCLGFRLLGQLSFGGRERRFCLKGSG